MDTEFIKYLSTLGLGGILAAFMFHFYRKDVERYTELWRGQSEQLIQVVKENTTAITSNAEITKALHKHITKE